MHPAMQFTRKLGLFSLSVLTACVFAQTPVWGATSSTHVDVASGTRPQAERHGATVRTDAGTQQDPAEAKKIGLRRWTLPKPEVQVPAISPTTPARRQGTRTVRLASGTALIDPDIVMHPNPGTHQSEMTIWTHPTDPDIVLAGSNAAAVDVSLLSQGWYYSTNGGAAWIGSDTLPTHTNFSNFMSDPAVGIDVDGNLFFNALEIGSPTDCFVIRSTNNGSTWTKAVVPDGSSDEDKNHMAVDISPASPFLNHVYTAYTDFNTSPSAIDFSRSTDRGVTFSAPVAISGTVGADFAQGINMAVGPQGQVYASWTGYDAWPPPQNTRLGFNRSTDGGATWQGAVTLDTIMDLRGQLTKGGQAVRVASFPSMAVDRGSGPRGGWIYIVYPERTATAPDIFLVRSTNGGTTWSAPVRVNQDTTTRDQWYPWMSVDPTTGMLYVVYYDSRNFAANDSAQVFVSISLDGGFTFEDVLVSDVPFLPTPIAGLAGGYMGDYIGVSALDGVVWPCWNDNRTGVHQGYTSRMLFIQPGTPATISARPDTLNFGDVYLGHPEMLSLSIRNMGFPETLLVSSIVPSSGEFSTNLSSLVLPGGVAQPVQVTWAPSSPGFTSATLDLTSNDSAHPLVHITLLGQARECPTLALAPSGLTDTLFTGGNAVRTIYIKNVGAGVLDFSFPDFAALQWDPRATTPTVGGGTLYTAADLVVAVTPVSGNVPAGDSLGVLVTLSAANLIGGDYTDSLVIASNDCALAEARASISLHVIGAPDILLSDTAIDFQAVFIGAAAVETLLVSNAGTDSLFVSGMTVSPAEFTLSLAPFRLAVGQSRPLAVTFTPGTPGPVTGSLTMVTNDPDEATVQVALAGLSLEPPVITVAPDSLKDSLFTGETSVQYLTVYNEGVSPLEFFITNVGEGAGLLLPDRDAGAFQTAMIPTEVSLADRSEILKSYEEYARAGAAGSHAAPPGPPREASVRDVVQASPSAFAPDSFVIFEDDMESGANGWTHYSTYPGGLDLWAQVGLRSHSGTTAWQVPQHAGVGSEALQSPPIDLTQFSEASLGFWHWYNFDDCSGDPLFEPDGGLVEVSTDGGSNWTQIVPVGGYPYVIDDYCGNPLAFRPAYSHDGSMGASFIPALFDLTPFVGQQVTIRFQAGWDCGNCEFNEGWYVDDVSVFSQGVGWLTALPSAGTVPAGETLSVAVTFDAGGLFGGDYRAQILVTSNDPITPVDSVAAFLHVTGAPDIAVGQDTLDFDTVFVAYPDTLLLGIANEGTDSLFITGITSSNGDFAVGVSTLSIAAAESTVIAVVFTPAAAGAVTGALAISSNDPDEPSLQVVVKGFGLEPPVLSVSPDSLRDSLFTGESSVHTLTIQNDGLSPLDFSIVVEELTAPLQASNHSPDFGTAQGQTESSRQAILPYAATGPGPTLNLTHPTTAPAPLAGVYTGDHLRFGLSDLGEIMPFQYPVGNEHLQIGSYLSGYTVAYMTGPAVDNVCWAGFESRFGLTPVSYTELRNDATEVQVEVVVRTNDSRLQITRTFSFRRSTKSVNVTTRLANVGGGPLTDVVYKCFADWDVDAAISSNVWNYDFERHMAYASQVHYAAIAGEQMPDLMDINGWDDYTRRATIVDIAAGPVVTDGLEVLHYELTDLAISAGHEIQAVFTVGDNLPELQANVDKAFFGWLTAAPLEGTVAPGLSVDVAVTFDATNLFGGDYTANIVITSNDPAAPELLVPAFLHVTGAPDIAVSDTAFNFGTVFIGASPVETLLVSNEGTDSLHVSSISSNQGDYSVLPAAFDLAVGEDQVVTVTFSPSSPGLLAGTLTVTSDDPDENPILLPLTGIGVEPPILVVSPDSLRDSLFTGETSTHILTISNAGVADLVWQAAATDGAGVAVLQSSATFESAEPPLAVKAESIEPWSVPSASEIHAMDPLSEMRATLTGRVAHPATASAPSSVKPTIEEALADLDANFAAVNSEIPNRFDFSEGVTGTYINDGGNDMYDGGNYLNTELGGPMAYSDGLIAGSGALGAGGRYFTRKYPGLFVFVADLQSVNEFRISGDVGADGSGSADGAVLQATVRGRSFHGFVKRIFNAFDPSVNHLILVEDDVAPGHEFATSTNDDYHRVFNLAGSRRIYYLLYAGSGGFYIDNAATLGIMTAFLNALSLGPEWLSISPASGIVPANGSIDLEVVLDAAGLIGGSYQAHVEIASNDPVLPEAHVPVFLHVTGAPDITLSDLALNFGTVFLGGSTLEELTVSNIGTDILHVSGITSSQGAFSALPGTFTLGVGANVAVAVVFSPGSLGLFTGTLAIASDDPDEDTVFVSLSGLCALPPIIEVTPDSLSERLFIGETSQQSLTITNSGGSDLVWSVRTEAVTAALYRLPAQENPGGQTAGAMSAEGAGSDLLEGSPARRDPVAALAATLNDLSGMTIGIAGFGSNYATITSDLQARGATVKFPSFPISQASLDSLDVLSIDDYVGNMSATDVARVRTWLSQGGGLLLQGDDEFSMANLNALLSGTGIVETYLGGYYSSVFTDILPHQTTAGVSVINGDSYGSYCSLSPPALATVRDDLARVHVAVSQFGSGRVMAAGNEVFLDFNISAGDTRLFSNQSFDWLAGVSWLRVEPTSGVTGSDTSEVLTVTFDARGLTVGDYQARILIESDDPATPTVEVPATLTVLDTALSIVFEGMCPANGTVLEGGAVAFEVTTLIAPELFVSLDLVSIRHFSLPAVPQQIPDVVGLDSVDTPNAQSLLVYWEPQPGEAGPWDFCFEAVSTGGLAETTCVSLNVVDPGPNVVRWQSRHYQYSSSGPISANLDLDFITGADSTFAVVGPFRLRSNTAPGPFITVPIDSGDGLFSAAMSVFEERVDQNPVFNNDAVSPDSLVLALVDLGGSALPAGTHTRAVSYPTTLSKIEGIFEIDTALQTPDNKLTFVLSAAQEITPDYAAGCYAVTIARNLPATVLCPVSDAGTAVFGDLVSVPGFSFDDPQAGPGPYTFSVASSSKDGLAASPVLAPIFVGDRFEWQTTNLDDRDVGLWEFCVQVNDGASNSPNTCCFTVEVVSQAPVICFEIGSTEAFSNADVCVPLTLVNLAGSPQHLCTELGGFDLLFTYDASMLTFRSVDLTGSVLESAGWEFFTYRILNGVPVKVRIVAIADMNNSNAHPSDYCIDGLLATLCFHTTNDRTFGCQSALVRFWWDNCTDNTASSRDGNTLFIVTDPGASTPWFGGDPEAVPPIPGGGIIDNSDSIQAQLATFEGGISGPASFPCENPDTTKSDPEQALYFVNGKIKIKCPGDIDDRGDLNLNSVAYEIADAVLYSNYFISGPAVFSINLEGQIAASDVNADGTPLTVSDLVYLIRVITGDAVPIEEDLLGGGPKPAGAIGRLEASLEQHGATVSIHAHCEQDLGAAFFELSLQGAQAVTVEAAGRAVDMEVIFASVGDRLRVLLYSLEDRARVPAGSGEVLVVRLNGGHHAGLERVEAASFEGGALESLISAKTLPSVFALHPSYPNPFNPTTAFAFDMPTAAEYSVRIFNITGQLVKTYSGHGEAGTHTFTWDGRSDQGSPVASGVYFYKAEAGGFSQTRKMMMLK